MIEPRTEPIETAVQAALAKPNVALAIKLSEAIGRDPMVIEHSVRHGAAAYAEKLAAHPVEYAEQLLEDAKNQAILDNNFAEVVRLRSALRALTA